MTTHPYTRLFPMSGDPTSGDDDSQGYEVGDIWLTSTSSFQCLDASTGAAIWLDLGAGGGGYTQEQIEDFVGAMVSGNTETGIAVTYDDTNGKLDFDAQTAGDARYAPIAKGVTNGDSHDHVGGDGAQIDHGGLAGLGDDDHTQYHNDARGDARYQLLDSDLTAIAALSPSNDDIIQRKTGAWVNRTLAHLITDLTEQIQDLVAAMFAAGSGSNDSIIVDYDDPSGALSVGVLHNDLKDIVGEMVTGGVESGIDVSYDAGHNRFDFDAQTKGDLRYIQQDGWIPVSATWTRTGNHTFTVSGDVTATYRKNTRVRYKDGGSYEYGVIASSSYSSPNTTVTLITNSDYAMAAATITDKYISPIINPEGFPQWFNWTVSWTNLTVGSGGTVVARWRAVAHIIHYQISVTLGTSPTVGNVSFTPPVAPTAVGSRQCEGLLVMLDAGVQNYFGMIMDTYDTSSNFNLRSNDVSGSHVINAVLSSTNPFTWGVSDAMYISGWYPY